MDVDVGGTPEPENTPLESARDGESDEIVRQLEKGLPRWEGFAGVGWAQNLSPVSHSILCFSPPRRFRSERFSTRIGGWRLFMHSQNTRMAGEPDSCMVGYAYGRCLLLS